MKQPQTLKIVLLFVAATFLTPAWGLDVDRYESQIKRGMEDWQIPGLATAVIEDGEVVYARGFGQTEMENGSPVTVDTPFAIASTTKAMLVAGLLKQVDEGAITLDDPVVQWLPELRFADPALAAELTLRDLLAHRTGMPSTDFLRFFQGMLIDEQMARLAFIPPVTQPRTRVIYQNTMYELAGIILERLTGQFWGDYLEASFWGPLEMDSTAAFRGRLAEGVAYAQPHDVFDGELRRVGNSRPPDEANAAGSVWSTVSDMTRWAQFLLRGGVTASGERLISEEAFSEWFEPAQLARPDDFYPVTRLTRPRWRSYALGWFQNDFVGRRIDFHTGSLSGLVAILGLDRDANRAVVVFANRDHAELRHALLWHALDPTPVAQRRDWHREVWDLYQSIREEDDAQWQEQVAGRIQDAPAPLPLEDYAGLYESDAWGPLVVETDSDGARLLSRSREFSLRHWHSNTFLAEYPDWQRGMFVEFRLAPDGTVSAVEMRNMTFARQTAEDEVER